jgi:hypothetical protein
MNLQEYYEAKKNKSGGSPGLRNKLALQGRTLELEPKQSIIVVKRTHGRGEGGVLVSTEKLEILPNNPIGNGPIVRKLSEESIV